MEKYKEARDGMKSSFKKAFERDRDKGIEEPEVLKAIPKDGHIIRLAEPRRDIVKKDSIFQILEDRKSRRNFTAGSISLDELSYLLWASQGVKEYNKLTRRTVPSAGSRHPYETYLSIHGVEGLEKGLYRYLPLEHSLLLIREEDGINERIAHIAMDRSYIKNSALVFIWACLPYRTEWAYGPNAHRVMLLDAGHIGQSLYMASESLGLGVCSLGSYDQEDMDSFLEVDGEDEFAVYIAALGKID